MALAFTFGALALMSMCTAKLFRPSMNPISIQPRISHKDIAQIHADGETPPWVMATHGEHELISRAPLEHGRPWDSHLTKALLNVLREGGSLMDIGCNIGSISLPVAAAFPYMNITSGRKRLVYCIEADPRNARLVHKSAVLNDFSHLMLFEGALQRHKVTGSTACMLTSASHALSSNMGGNVAKLLSDDAKCLLPVQSATLDTVVDKMMQKGNAAPIMALKMDCEGCEGNTFYGGRDFFTKTPPCHLAIELTPHRLEQFGTPMKEVFNLILSYGYVPTSVSGCRPKLFGLDECKGEDNIMKYFTAAFDTKDEGLPNGEKCNPQHNCVEPYVKSCTRTCTLMNQFNFWFHQRDLETCKKRVLG